MNRRLQVGASLLALGLALAGMPEVAIADTPPPRVLAITDAGVEIDDQFALVHLARSRRVDLAAVITTHAPSLAYPPAKTAATVAKEALNAAGRPTIPVVTGLEARFGDEQDIRPSPATAVITKLASTATPDRRLKVAVLGPITELALALAVEPSLADRLEVVAVAFDSWPIGGDGGNVKADPEAWRIVLANKVPLVMVDAAVAKQHLTVDAQQVAAWGAGSQAGGYLARLFATWTAREAARCKAATGRADAWRLRDHGAVAWLLGKAEADVHAKPHMALNLRFTTDKQAPGSLRWLTRIDSRAVWQDLSDSLGRSNKN